MGLSLHIIILTRALLMTFFLTLIVGLKRIDEVSEADRVSRYCGTLLMATPVEWSP